MNDLSTVSPGGYTASVHSLMRLLVAVVSAVTLVGSPAVVAACVTLCGTGHEGHRRAAASDVAQPVPEAAHHHHHEGMASGGAPLELMPAAETGTRLFDGSCCEHDGRALPSLASAVRMELDAGSWPADHAVPGLRRLVSSRLTSPRGGPPPLARTPAAPSVLRI